VRCWLDVGAQSVVGEAMMDPAGKQRWWGS
jgi:hypothetical protein